jgi:hypothetical protein
MNYTVEDETSASGQSLSMDQRAIREKIGAALCQFSCSVVFDCESPLLCDAGLLRTPQII